MNTEDSEFERIEREAKLRQVPLPEKIYDYEEAYFALKAKRALAVPDPIHHTDLGESLEYIQGWNDCRQAMLAEQPAQPAQQEPVAYGLIRQYINALVLNKPDDAATATKAMVDYIYAGAHSNKLKEKNT